MSASRRWPPYVALAGLALVATPPLAARMDWIPLFPAMLSAAAGSLLCVGMAVLATWWLVRPARGTGHHGVAWLTLALAATPAINALALLRHAGLPAIHNISTDPRDPPRFEAAAGRRGPDSNPLAYSADNAAAQREGYPELRGLNSTLNPQAAYRRARDTALALGWETYHENPAAGLIEATDVTFWFGFKDDIAIRIRASGNGSRIDLRSVSRVGQGDLGANAARIREFMRRFPAQL